MKQGKRVLAGLLALVMLVSSLTMAAFAAASAGMEVTTDGASLTELKAGDTVTVKITLPAMEKMCGAELHLEYDKDRLDYQEKFEYDEDEGTNVKVVNTKLPQSWGPTITDKATADTTGKLQFNAAGTANRAITADFNLLTVEFKVREDVSGSVEFKVSLFNLGYINGLTETPITYVTAPAAKTVVIPKAPITEVTASGISIPHTGNLAPTYSPAPATTPAPGEEADPYEFAGFAWFKSMEDAEKNRNALTSTDIIMGSTQYVVRLVFKANTADGNIFADKVTVKLNGASIGEFTPNAAKDTLVACYKMPNATDPRKLSSISVAQMPPLEYIEGQYFSTAGLKLTVNYDDRSSETITEGFTVQNGDKPLTYGTTQMVVEYTEDGITKTATIDITVAKNELVSIAVSGSYKTAYQVGESFDYTGMVVTATFKDNSTKTVALADVTLSGFDSSAETASGSATISYTKDGVTKTAPVAYTVSKWVLTKDDIIVNLPAGAVYNGHVHPITVSYAGGITEAEAGSLAYTCDGFASGPTAPGTHSVTVSTAGGTKYQAARFTYTMEVARAASGLAASDTSLVVGKEQTIAYTLPGVSGGEAPSASAVTFTLVDGGEFVTLDAATGKITATAAGTAHVKVSFAGDTYYLPAEVTFAVTVTTKRAVTVTLTAKSDMNYDANLGNMYPQAMFNKATVSGNTLPEQESYWTYYFNGDGLEYTWDGLGNRVMVPAVVGSYTLKAVYENDEEYGVDEATFNILPIDQTTELTLTPETVKFGQTAALVAGGGDGTGAYTVEIIEGGTGAATLNGTALTPTAVGTVKVRVTRAAGGNYKAASREFTIPITKGSAPALTIGNFSYRYTKDGRKVESLPTGMPADAGTVSWSFEVVSDPNGIISGGSVSLGTDGRFVFDIAAGKAAGSAATIKATAASDNYASAEVTFTVTLTDRDNQEALVITSGTEVTFGNTLALATSGGSGTGVVTYTVTDGNGSATVANGVLTTVKAGTVTVVAHKAGDDDYNAVDSDSVTITIHKAKPVGRPGFKPVTAGNKTLADVPLDLGTINVPGTVAWVDAPSTVVKPNQAYEWKFTPNEPDNYEELTGKLTPYNYMPDQGLQDIRYPISIAASANGTVTADRSTAKKGELVTLTVTPAAGYKLDKLVVRNATGGSVEFAATGAGSYSFNMPISSVYVSAAFVKAEAVSAAFADVKDSDWFAGAVDYVYRNGMMNGVGGGLFDPNGSVTRGMLMTVLARMAGVNTAGSQPWYKAGMDWAKAVGVSDGTNPEGSITREQVAVMLYRYCGAPAAGAAVLDSAPDGARVSDWAKDAMNWALSVGLMRGDESGKLNPQGGATRAEVATMLMRFAEQLKK